MRSDDDAILCVRKAFACAIPKLPHNNEKYGWQRPFDSRRRGDVLVRGSGRSFDRFPALTQTVKRRPGVRDETDGAEVATETTERTHRPGNGYSGCLLLLPPLTFFFILFYQYVRVPRGP